MIEPLSPKQRESYHAATARINLWHGAVRSGKTVACDMRWIERCRRGPPGDRVMVGKTERTLRRNVLTPLERVLGPKRIRVTAGAGEATILGRRVYLVGANDERAEQKIRGGTFADAYGDEITLWPRSFFQMLLSRLSVPGAALFGTTNPDAPLHWLKRDFIDRAAELDLRAFHFRLEDNPYLDPQYVASLKREYTGLWYTRFIDGAWVMAEGAIWDAFSRGLHCVQAVPEEVTLTNLRVAVDYGTANPFVALLLADGSDGRLWVLEEYRWDSAARGRQLTDSQYSVALRDRWGASESELQAFAVDPSAASFRAQLAGDWNVQVIEADNAVEDGLREVGGLFAKDGIRIVEPECEVLCAEIESYVWDPKAQARGEDAPLKRNDHGPDALRYGTRTRLPGFLRFARQQLAEHRAGGVA